MVGIRFHGRGGQGAVVASKILVHAYFKQGLYVQAFPSFGMERKGAAVSAFVRLDSVPIVERGDIKNPDVVIVLDSSLLRKVDVTQGVKPNALILLNCRENENQNPFKGSFRVAGVDAVKIALQHGLGSKTAGCWSSLIGIYPYTCITVPVVSVAFGATASVAAGIKAGLTIQGNDHTTVLAFAGDGGTFDIGFLPLSGVVERNDDILFICYDNEAYMNTGIQRSGLTPFSANTTTTPKGAKSFGNLRTKKPMPEIARAHGIPYVATASIGFPQDIQRKVKKAFTITGPKYLQIHVPCPLGWQYAPNKSIDMGKLAVETGLFPLIEYENGKLTGVRKIAPKPVEEYVKAQGRFKHLLNNPDEIKKIQEIADNNIARYGLKVEPAPA